MQTKASTNTLTAIAAFLFLLTIAAFMPAAALAASDADELERAGYLGVWALDCNKPPAPDNWHFISERRSDGSVIDTSYTGSNRPQIVRTVKFIRRAAANQIEIIFIEKEGSGAIDTVNLTIQLEPQRLRTLHSVSKLHGEFIRDGKFTSGRGAALWFNRCTGKKIS